MEHPVSFCNEKSRNFLFPACRYRTHPRKKKLIELSDCADVFVMPPALLN
jgi:hypothetical protein